MKFEEIEIRELSKRGFFLGKINDKDIQVLYTDVGEIVEGKIFSKKKRLYCTDIHKIKKKSKHRIKPECKYYYHCGGCCFQHISYNREKEIKIKQAVKFLKKEPSDYIFSNIYNYRNSLEFDITHNKAGMHPRMSHYINNIDNCMLMDEDINKYLKEIVQKKKNNYDGEIRIVKSDDKILARWYPKYESKETTPDKLKHGEKKYKGKIFHISPDTFFQANDDLYGKWLDRIKALVKEEEKKYDRVVELFSGVGTISLYIQDLFERVTMVENNELSLYLANKSIEKMNLDKSKFNIIKKDLFNETVQLEGGDLLIVNPPRAGLSKKVVKYIKNNKFNDIIYSSCNYKTFTRDLKKLEQYWLEDYYIYDMFPRTYHFEVLSKLRRKK